MTELLLKDQLELQKRAAERTDWEKIAGLQEAISVLKTRFDAAIESIREKLGDAVSDEDIKELKREWETALRDAISGIREHFTTANEQQSNSLLGQVELMLARDRAAAETEAKKTRQQYQMVIFVQVVGIIGALIVFYMTTRPH
jgi:hypothetical protein